MPISRPTWDFNAFLANGLLNCPAKELHNSPGGMVNIALLSYMPCSCPHVTKSVSTKTWPLFAFSKWRELQLICAGSHQNILFPELNTAQNSSFKMPAGLWGVRIPYWVAPSFSTASLYGRTHCILFESCTPLQVLVWKLTLYSSETKSPAPEHPPTVT